MKFKRMTGFTLFALVLAGCGEEVRETEPGLCRFEQGPCVQLQAGESLSLSMTPVNAPSEHPLSLTLAKPGNWRVTSAVVEGRDMFMGRLPIHFDEQGQGTLMYGSCASGYMVWRLNLVMTDETGLAHYTSFDWLADR